MKATNFNVNGREIQVPSHADLVVGLEDYVNRHIAAYDNSTVDAKIAGLSSVYLGKTAKAVNSSKADYAAEAGKATLDSAGQQITTTYYKKTDTVDRAAADDQGNNFRQKYALITGTVANASYATTAGAASKATLDGAGNNINTTYIKEITASGQTVTYKRGNNTTGTFTTKDTTYNAATTSAPGLMSAADKIKLNALSTDTGSFNVNTAVTAQRATVATTADKLTTARSISITGDVQGSATFDGSANISINVEEPNVEKFTWLNPTDNYDLNQITVRGLYGSSAYLRDYNHRPVSGTLTSSFMLRVETTHTRHNIWQELYNMFYGSFYRRTSHDNGNTWSAWKFFEGETIDTYEAETGGEG